MNLLFLFFILISILVSVSAQSPAEAPAPPQKTNVTAVLEKAGQFTTFIRLLQSTKVADQLNTQLNNSNQGITILAPGDGAFSGLKPGTLNSFTDEQKVQLIQFHILPSFFSPSSFQTASNPLRTQAGGSEGSFPMNVTASGNQVNITTGVTNATIANTIYTDGQLAVYQVDQVLLPLSFFAAPPPAPSPSSPKKTKSDDSSVASRGVTVSSSATSGVHKGWFTAIIAAVIMVVAAFS